MSTCGISQPTMPAPPPPPCATTSANLEIWANACKFGVHSATQVFCFWSRTHRDARTFRIHSNAPFCHLWFSVSLKIDSSCSGICVRLTTVCELRGPGAHSHRNPHCAPSRPQLATPTLSGRNGSGEGVPVGAAARRRRPGADPAARGHADLGPALPEPAQRPPPPLQHPRHSPDHPVGALAPQHGTECHGARRAPGEPPWERPRDQWPLDPCALVCG